MKKTIAIILGIMFLLSFFAYKAQFFAKTKQTNLVPYNYNREYFQKEKQNNIQQIKNLEKFNLYCLKKKNRTCQALPHQNIISDSIRLKSIQYAGQNNKNTSTLNQDLNIIHTLNPNRNYPYIFAQRILPIAKESPQYTEKEKISSRKNTIKLGEKGIVYNCLPDSKKIAQTHTEKELKKQHYATTTKNSLCQDYRLPQYLAFNYFQLLKNEGTSSIYYKMAALSNGSPEVLLNMPTIILGRGGQHFKSASIWLEKGQHLTNDPSTSEEDIKYFLNKAVYERTLDLITEAENSQKECSQDLACLQKNKDIQKTIKKRLETCKNYGKNSDQTIQTKCRIAFYAIENGFIKTDGTLIYPPISDDEFVYAWRPDRKDRGIILKE